MIFARHSSKQRRRLLYKVMNHKALQIGRKHWRNSESMLSQKHTEKLKNRAGDREPLTLQCSLTGRFRSSKNKDSGD